LAELTEDDVERAFAALTSEAKDLMRETASPAIQRAVDARYAGQSFELTIRLPTPRTPITAIAEIFAREHERTSGHRADTDPVQIVNVRVVARIPRDGASPSAVPGNKSSMKKETWPTFGTPGSKPGSCRPALRPAALILERRSSGRKQLCDRLRPLSLQARAVLVRGAQGRDGPVGRRS